MADLTEDRRADIIAGNYRPRLGGISAETRKAVLVDAGRKIPVAQIAAEHEISSRSVYTILHENKIEVFHPQRPHHGNSRPMPYETREAVAEALRAKWAPTRIGAEFGISDATVIKIGKEFGITSPNSNKRRLSPELREKVLHAIEENPNQTRAQVAAATGVHIQSIDRITGAANVKLRHGEKLPVEEHAKIVARLESTRNAMQVSKETGRSYNAVWTIAQKAHIDLPRGRRPKSVKKALSPGSRPSSG